MGLLYMGDSGHDLHVRYIAEASKLLGQEALLYQVDKKEFDLQNDPDVKYKPPIKINFLLDQNPTPILKKLHWFTEDEELPYLGYLTRLANDYSEVSVEPECIVEVMERQVDQYIPRKFTITSVRGSKLNPLYWICKLVPYRENGVDREVVDYEAPQNTDMGYSYVQRK